MSHTRHARRIAVGDRVCYAASWLRSTGNYTGDLPFARGTVTRIIELGETALAEVDWGNPDIPARVHIGNLSRVTERGIADE